MQLMIVCDLSMTTSGSTIGASWHSPAYRASALAFALTQADLGRASVT
jgi:hypothetical protein